MDQFSALEPRATVSAASLAHGHHLAQSTQLVCTLELLGALEVFMPGPCAQKLQLPWSRLRPRAPLIHAQPG